MSPISGTLERSKPIPCVSLLTDAALGLSAQPRALTPIQIRIRNLVTVFPKRRHVGVYQVREVPEPTESPAERLYVELSGQAFRLKAEGFFEFSIARTAVWFGMMQLNRTGWRI